MIKKTKPPVCDDVMVRKASFSPQDYPCIAAVGLGKTNVGVCEAERCDTSKENIREAVSGKTCFCAYVTAYKESFLWLFILVFSVCSAGCRLLQDLEVKHVEVDPCGDAQSAAEGAVLGLFQYDQHKAKKKTKTIAQLYER